MGAAHWALRSEPVFPTQLHPFSYAERELSKTEMSWAHNEVAVVLSHD